MDAYLYFRQSKENQLSALAQYLNDILVTSENTIDAEWIMTELSRALDGQGYTKKCLGLHLEQSDTGIFLLMWKH
ncbi:hypothetical protein GN244_ATG06035 [Phytophthora infestans]|uniref:Uncharacterized protein n=1 Tax=Phytophthora infestans TaxID=4787 RepID=A0A833WH09_PHYIN|nr:hypothetical protein GN244_ATG06035 [Phytophthora infestans]KAF4135322.1 hypothetical protein GN958_ATG15510 [Phytophthora infestans]